MNLRKEEASAEIPASSMADIAFLLIIYFMVTTTFAATRGLDFALPKDDDTPPVIEKEDSVLIEIDPSGQILVDQKPMTGYAILEYLDPKLSANPKKPVIIKPNEVAPYGHMVEVFDILRQARIIDSADPAANPESGKELVWLRKRQGLTEEILEAGKDINVSIPTRREIDAFWI